MNYHSMRVDDRVAVVTGSGQGIGQAIAKGLAHYGANLVVTELSGKMENAERVAYEIKNSGRDAIALPLDVRKVKSIERMVEKILSHYGRVDILVNNAGINIPQSPLEVTEKNWDAIIDTNLKGTFFCSQKIIPHMIEKRGEYNGKIINMASQNGIIAYYDRTAYCSSKGGVVNLTRQLALEWAKYEINVNAVGPTYIETEHTKATLSDSERRKDILSRIPMGKIATLEDIVGPVVFLASPASDMITGQTLLIDGGWTVI